MPALLSRAWGGAIALLLAACAPERSPPADAGAAPASVIDVVELGATDALRRMADGTLSSRDLTQAYLDRIAAIDDDGPRLNAVIDLNPDALAEAATRDAERGAGQLRGALHGLPILLKDNIDVAGMVNSAGSLALADNRAGRDAFLVMRLRAAGAVILGRTNLSEWANFRSTRAISGWSSRGGQTRNPYVLDRNPCGSSSGTAVAMAASLAALGVGTETNGSILCPAAVNGLAAMKPTVGVISRAGIIPIAISQDSAGPMARSVADVALLLNALAGADPADPAGGAAQGRIPRDYTAYLDVESIAGKRFGLVRQAMGYHPDVDAATERVVAVLRERGATVVEVTIPTWRQWSDAALVVLLHEFKQGLNDYLATATAGPTSLQALIEWNRAHATEVMPLFGQDLFEQAQATGPLTETVYLRARDTARRLAGREGLVAVLDGQRLDALLAPTTSPAWLTDPVLGDHFLGAGYGIAAVAGTPSLTVPMGASHGLPLGITLMGRAYAEGELLGFGHALEQVLRARGAPQFLPTIAP